MREDYLKIKIKGLPPQDEIEGILHYMPHAYCVVKLTPRTAVFVCPPQVNRLHKESMYSDSHCIENHGAAPVFAGKWYSIAYCCMRCGSGVEYIVPHQPDPKESE